MDYSLQFWHRKEKLFSASCLEDAKRSGIFLRLFRASDNKTCIQHVSEDFEGNGVLKSCCMKYQSKN
jgi:hypothetical protein